jgi:hypothetical protein
VLNKKRAIPVAWDKPAWNPIGAQRWRALAPAFPPDGRVLGLTDRGLDSPEWFESIRQLGAHPVMQTDGDGRVLVAGGAEWQALQDLVPCPNTRGEGRCRVIRINTLECTVLAVWACGRREAWMVLTDLPPCEVSGGWHRYRVG